MIRKGEKDKAAKLLDKNFEAFPNFNFPYDAQTMYFLEPYIQAGAYDKAKKHIQILAGNLLANLKFYNSLDAADKNGTFQRDFMQDLQTKEQLIRLVETAGDAAYKQELDKMFAAYKIEQMLPQQQ